MSGQALNSWNKATEELFELDRRAKAGTISDHEALFALSHIVSYLVVAVGALLVNNQEGGST